MIESKNSTVELNMRWMKILFSFLIPCFFLYAQTESISMKSPIVIFETSLGQIEVTLMSQVAPKACENFLGLVDKHSYDGVVFHRVIKNFMIQTGDPTGTGAGGESIWKKPFVDECSANIKFDKPGLLAMANRGPNTNGSQFFITTAATPWLNMRHTIFGVVSSGYEVAKQIEAVKTDAKDRPLEAVKIIRAYRKS